MKLKQQETKRLAIKIDSKGVNEREAKYYIHVMIETKDARVRVTYLAAALKVSWALSGSGCWIRRKEQVGCSLIRRKLECVVVQN